MDYTMNARVGRAGGPVSTVGRDLEHGIQMSYGHPRYVAQTEYADKLFEERLTKETEKFAKSKQAVCTVVLDAAQREVIKDDFPEFRIIWARMSARVSPMFVARRQLTNQLMIKLADQAASSYIHYGGTALDYMTAGISDVHLHVNDSSVPAMQNAHHDAVECATVMSSVDTAAASVNWFFKKNTRSDYASGKHWVNCQVGETCRAAADALLVDGSMYSMSTSQFMHAMQQHSCDTGYFALPYTSQMMVESKGDLTDTGVMFDIHGDSIRFVYPDGIVGTMSYAPGTWHGWLANVERNEEGLRSNYQFELLNERPAFQIVRVVRVPKRKVPKQTIVHSLQLPNRKDKLLVSAWTIKDLMRTPHSKASWEMISAIIPTAVVVKTYEFAMALPPEDFSRVNIRKRFEIYNDRVIVEGQRVRVEEPLTAHQVRVGEVAIFLSAFVRRYEAGQLSASLMNVLRAKQAFGDYPNLFVRFLIATWFVSDSMFSIAYRCIDDYIRGTLDAVIEWFRGDGVRIDTSFTPAPQFVRIETAVSAFGSKYLERLTKLVTRPSSVFSACRGAAGYAQTMMMGTDGRDDEPDLMFRVPDDAVAIPRTGDIFCDYVDTSLGRPATNSGTELYSNLRRLNAMDEALDSRHVMSKQWVEQDVGKDIMRTDFSLDPGFIDTINQAHEAVFPGMAQPDFHYDTSNMALFDQHRNFTADYLRMSTEMNQLPSNQKVYKSKITAYATAKRRGVMQELLSSMESRNLAAPIVTIPQNDEVLLKSVWDNFLDTMCLPDAREKLAKYQVDPVGLEKTAVLDWATKARPDNLQKLLKYVVEHPECWEEMRIDEYNAILKPDVKPPLSDKPLTSYLASQVIVHHKPVINAVFSSILRVLVRRFESLLKPNVYVNLLKDMPYIRDVIQVNHSWKPGLQFLENDFSKYDKSQHRFVFLLETYIYEQLGMNQEMLDKWELGHVDCKIQAVNVGLSLHVRYQRKSGDAGTAFANGLVNAVSVAYAYQGTKMDWAVFIGDDSLVCTEKVVGASTAVQSLAEHFNLMAKYYNTPAPYFASNFIVFNDREKRVTAVPDPFKRAEKFSQSVPADDPKWKERYQSAKVALEPYLRRGDNAGLLAMVPLRYDTRGYNISALVDAIATAVSSFDKFRSMWEAEPTTIVH